MGQRDSMEKDNSIFIVLFIIIIIIIMDDWNILLSMILLPKYQLQYKNRLYGKLAHNPWLFTYKYPGQHIYIFYTS